MPRIPLAVLLLLFSITSAFSQNASYSLQHYTDENGLPQNSVKFIAPDTDGFIWLSTEDGLVRFDGSRFLRFGGNNIQVSSNRFQAIYPGPDGEGLYCFNSSLEQVQIKDGKVIPAPAKQHWLQQKLKYDTSYKWIRYADGLSYMNAELKTGMQKTVIRINDSCNISYDGNALSYHIHDKPTRTIPFSTRDDWKFFVIKSRLYLLQKNGRITSFAGNAEKRMLEGDILQDSLYKAGRQTANVFWNICIPDGIVIYFNRSFYTVTETSAGTLTTRLVFSDFDGEGNNICAAFYNNRTGKLYLGSIALGFFVLSPKPFRSITSPLHENIFYSQAAFSREKIITSGNILFDVSGKSKDSVLPKRTPDDFTSLFLDKQGNFWKKWRAEMYRYSLAAPDFSGKWILPDLISILYYGIKGRVWIGLRRGGIYRLPDSATATPPLLFRHFTEAITYMQQVNTDVLYAGSEKGLYRLHISTQKVDTVHALQGKQVRSIYAVSPDEVWITTYGDGFFLYKNGKLTVFPLDRDAYLLTSHCMVEDRKGFFWISTNKGLFQAKKKDLLNYAAGSQKRIYYYYRDRSEGFNTNEFNGGCQPCALKLASDYISFPSMDGLVVFKPDSLDCFLPDAGLFIDQVRLDKHAINEADLMRLPRHFGQLSFQISSPYGGNPKNLYFEYALTAKGQVPVWSPVPATGVLSLSTIPEGEYMLMIRKPNGFGADNFTSKRIPLFVIPAWYRTAWFYTACLLLVIAGTWLLARLRIKYIEKQNRQLEELVGIKRKELQWRSDIQGKIIRSISHDIQTPLQYHKIISEKIYTSLLSGEKSSALTFAKALNDSAHQLHYQIGNLLKYLKFETTPEPPDTENIDLRQLIEDKRTIFQPIAAEKRTVIYNNIPSETWVNGNGQLLAVIIHHLLDNAVKITEEGIITIDAKCFEDIFWIIIEDTGPGMGQFLQDWINSPLQKDKRTIVPKEYLEKNGMGLLMVKELSIIAGIRLHVTAEPRKGTCFTIIC